MKLRIRDDSLRLRLGQAEVSRIARGEAVEGCMHLPGGNAFRYRLEGASDATVDVVGDGSGLTVRVAADALDDWARDDTVSLALRCADDGARLDVLIEKDFACLTARDGDDDADSFPHPEAGNSTC
ncbi:MAG: hypothetical protein AAGM16_00570 [Pseudomonadota bacterium]|mgnify:CR=1 FL=1